MESGQQGNPKPSRVPFGAGGRVADVLLQHYTTRVAGGRAATSPRGYEHPLLPARHPTVAPARARGQGHRVTLNGFCSLAGNVKMKINKKSWRNPYRFYHRTAVLLDVKLPAGERVSKKEKFYSTIEP